MKIAFLASAAIVAHLGLSAPAMAQTTPNPPPVTHCGTVCPVSSLTVTGVAAFGGSVLGSFGSVDANGNLVNANGVTGTVRGTKNGGGNVDITQTYTGAGCSINCGQSSIRANVNAFERGEMAVTVAGNTAGNTFGIANSGTLSAATGLSIGYRIGTPPSPTN